MNAADKIVLDAVALQLGVEPDTLARLIRFETAGTFSPTIKNPRSSARGLLQFVDSTAQELGFRNSADLVNQLPTFQAQMRGAVYPYLRRYMPFDNEQSLYMAVFYPAARKWPSYKRFPEIVTRLNPGIETPADYVQKVNEFSGIKKKTVIPLLFLASMLLIFTIKKRRYGE